MKKRILFKLGSVREEGLQRYSGVAVSNVIGLAGFLILSTIAIVISLSPLPFGLRGKKPIACPPCNVIILSGPQILISGSLINRETVSIVFAGISNAVEKEHSNASPT